jgi:two-component system sensor histidine kinase YesM
MRWFTHILLFIAAFLSPLVSLSQNAEPKKKETPAELKKAADNLEISLIENDDYKIARNYELLAQEFSDKDDEGKAEEYLFKALEIYGTAKNATGRARIIRNIAKAQEAQNKLQAATQNYKLAADIALDKTSKTLNYNDYKRLKNIGNTDIQSKYLEANITILSRKNKSADVADAYMQQALLSLKDTDSISAIEKYRQALKYTGNTPAKAIKIYSAIAEIQVFGKQYNEAIETIELLLKKARESKNYSVEIAQLKYLATIYFTINQPEEAIKALNESYKVASVNGKTFEARESVMLLSDHYKSVENDSASMDIYEEFFQNLDRIILSDTSLTDAKTFKVTEERIRRLESEKMFRDELITRKNTFNYVLLGFMVLLILLLAFIVKALYSIKSKNKEIALQSLRREMNPHFLFNSLNSVNQFIAQNNELAANKYLTSYSNLMRNTMENSNKDFVTLGNEIENLTQYLELEHLRFKDKFDFEIKVDKKLDYDSIWIPNMIVQPHIENAIWHGLRYKEDKGLLIVNIELAGKLIIISVDDNGIGPTKSNELKTHNQKAHQSRGLTNTRERMTLLNELYKTKMDFTVTEKASPETGTIVQIIFPIINKP